MSSVIIQADARRIPLADGSVQMVCTSPPYYALRDYNVAGQIGQEKSPDEYVANMAGVFAEAWRVLRDDGVMWLNLGDSFAGSGKGTGGVINSSKQRSNAGSYAGAVMPTTDIIDRGKRKAKRWGGGNAGGGSGLKAKDMIGIPWRMAFALQGFAITPFASFSAWADELRAARDAGDWQAVEVVEGKLRAMDLLAGLQARGWYLRRDVIFSKLNAMPESVTDRPSSSHEYVFLLTKSARYYYDGDAIKSPKKEVSIAREQRARLDNKWTDGADGQSPHSLSKPRRADKQRGHGRRHEGFNDRWDAMSKEEQQANGANARSVWEMATSGYKGEHFATMPMELAKKCILAGSQAGDVVFDPFTGSGTTGKAAIELGRRFVGTELSRAYIRLAEKRTTTTMGMMFHDEE